MYPKVCIIVVSWNRKNCVMNCLKSLAKVSYPNYETIVVDNASVDGSSEEIESSFPHIELVRNRENLGYTGGNNVGIEHSIKRSADYIVLLNDDIVVSPSFLTEMIKASETDRQIGVAGPKILCLPEKARIYRPYGKINYYLQLGLLSLNRMEEPTEVDWVCGAALLIKKETVEKVGLLDTDFFLYFDEADFCERAKKMGCKIVYVPSSIVYHDVSRSFSDGINPVQLYYITRNELLFARKHLNLLVFFPLFFPRFFFRIVTYWFRSKDIQVIRSIVMGFIDFTRSRYGKTISPEADTGT